jgi:translocating chain-associated membrane protein 1
MAGPTSTTLRKRSKAVPYLSHEFIIQNHGDIATCVAMVFVVGLMFQFTSPLASTFVALKHNVTAMDGSVPILYTYGLKDLCLLVFYMVAAIIFHAIVQEYILDKLNRKVRLSKIKAAKFNESGQLLAFYVFSLIWAFFIFKDEGYFQSLSFFWTGYPQVGVTFMTKFYFIFQISYWIHTFPELYLQKVKKDEYFNRIAIALFSILVAGAIYVFNFSRIGITLLSLEHLISSLFHLSRLLHYSNKNQISKISFTTYNFVFVIGRLTAIILSIFVFWFGLKSSSVEAINCEERNFNTFSVRLLCLVTVIGVQALIMWNFILFQCKKLRESSKSYKAKTTTPNKPSQTKKLRSSRDQETSGASGSDGDAELDAKSK